MRRRRQQQQRQQQRRAVVVVAEIQGRLPPPPPPRVPALRVQRRQRRRQQQDRERARLRVSPSARGSDAPLPKRRRGNPPRLEVLRLKLIPLLLKLVPDQGRLPPLHILMVVVAVVMAQSEVERSDRPKVRP